jgi:hypothetical protein
MPAPIAASTPRERGPSLTSSRAIFSRNIDIGSLRPGTSRVTLSSLTRSTVPMILLGVTPGARIRTRMPGVSDCSSGTSSANADAEARDSITSATHKQLVFGEDIYLFLVIGRLRCFESRGNVFVGIMQIACVAPSPF